MNVHVESPVILQFKTALLIMLTESIFMNHQIQILKSQPCSRGGLNQIGSTPPCSLNIRNQGGQLRVKVLVL